MLIHQSIKTQNMILNEIIHTIDELIQEYGYLFLEEHITYIMDFRGFLHTLIHIGVGKELNLCSIHGIHNIIAINIMHIVKLIKLYQRIINKTI